MKLSVFSHFWEKVLVEENVMVFMTETLAELKICAIWMVSDKIE